MKKCYLLMFFVLFSGFLAGQSTNYNNVIIEKSGKTVRERFNAPAGFDLINPDSNSFAFYLQNIPLKPMNALVKYYNGQTKQKSGVYLSVVDMDIDAQDLQQCADAVMRLKAEYHYQRKEYDRIHFNFLSDGCPRYYTNYVKGDYSYKAFRKFMRYIFSYANTASLFHELKEVNDFNDMQIGDVFIQKGNPYGHAVIVVNMAVNKATGEKLYMLAQSYMPAQETQILMNRNESTLNPWYRLKAGIVNTPEWEFNMSDLKRFNE